MAEQPMKDPLTPGFVPICAIGASAGGVTALQAMFRLLPTDLGLAYVVILHLAPDQPSALAEILSICTKMPVFQVDDGPTLKQDCVFVIPPDRELVIDGDSVAARPFTEPRGRRAPVDLFFRSIAAARGDGVAVVLSGAGADGALGIRAVKEAGGVVMVQEPAEAGFASMPQNAIASGVADFVAPIARLVDRLREVAHSKEAVRSLDMDSAANDLRRVVAFLRARTGHDFASYKRATVMRRVLRRMQVCRLDTLSGYADHLLANPEEAKELFGDLLISVTSFFRDARAFDALDRHAVKPLFNAVKPHSEEGIRGWVVGCATGEEAYSIAMLILEEMSRRKLFVPLQIFATDLDEGALATAREGRYPRTVEADVSEERLTRFFIDEGTHYRVRKDLREAVLFASHSVLKEPPFMRLDLVSCRNLLIYMERSLQQEVYGIFHYGLKPGGSLFLGSAETVDSVSDLFASLDRDARIYAARPKSIQALPILPQFAAPERYPAPSQMAAALPRAEQAGLSTAMHVAALEGGAPPSALVDDGHNILHLSPTAGRFILHSGGSMSNALPAVVRPELRLDLKFALTRAVEQSLPTLTHPAEVAFDGERRRIALHVVPVQKDERMGRHALVFFLDSGLVTQEEASTLAEAQPGEVRRLHGELRAAQEALVFSRHSHEASIQELRAANEELQSMNEEYRSTAEELETSKEELQSINEELHTVNAEMKSKLESISAAHSDLQNLMAATEVGTLFLDGHLRIRMFTPPVADIFNITAMDVGRTITDFTHQLKYRAVERDARRVLAELVPIEREVMSVGGRWYVMRLRPYRTVEDRIEGVVVAFVDITARLSAEKALGRSAQQLRALVRARSQVLYRMSPDWSEMRELSGGGVLFNTDQPTGSWFDAYIPSDEQGRVRAAIQEAVDTRGVFDLEHRVNRADGSVGWVHSRAIGSFDEGGQVTEWFGSASDITARREAEAASQESGERQAFLLKLSDAVQATNDPAAIEGTAMRMLGEHLGLVRTYYFGVEQDDHGWAHKVDAAYQREPDGPSMVGRHSLQRFGAWMFDGFGRGEAVAVSDVSAVAALTADEVASHRALGVAAFVNVPFLRHGEYSAGIGAQDDAPRAWTPAAIALIHEVGERTWLAVERARAETALRESEESLAANLMNADLLRGLAERLVTEDDDRAIYDEILSAAVAIARADAGIVQTYDPKTKSLDLLVSQNFSRSFAERFRDIDTDSRTACGVALKTGRRAFVDFADRGADAACALLVEEGIRSALAIPLVSRAGRQLGMLNTHWHQAGHRPTERQLRFLDLAARQAADLIEQRQAQKVLRESEERFAQFAASSSDGLWIRDAATLKMEYISPAIEAIYGVPPAALLDGTGRWTALILPDDRDTALAHLEEAKAGDAVIHEFRILRPSDGALRWIRNTDFPLRDAQGRVQRIGGIARDVTDMKAIEAALTDSEGRLRTLVEGMPLLVWRADAGGRWTWASPQWTAYTGQSDLDSHGEGWREPIHPNDLGRAVAAWDHALETDGFEVEYRIRRASDGAYRWFQTQATPVRGAAGEIVEWLGTSTDIDDLKHLQAQQAVMVAELQHRTRNLLGVVRGIANDTMDHTGPTDAFRDAFAHRLSALSRVQSLLSRSDAEPITIGALVRLELDALGAGLLGDRVSIAGPETFLRPSSVQTLALALHELATNARKYGALSHEAGHLAVTWRERVEGGETHLALDWVETGLEQAPDRPTPTDLGGGYGRELIEQALPHALGARTSYVLTASGVRCSLDLPVRPRARDEAP